jgi:uncharacterized membrane protein
MAKNSQIRAEARNLLGNKLLSANWLLAVAMFLLVSAVLSLPNVIIPGVGSLVVLVICGPAAIGLAAITLGMVRDCEKPNFQYLIWGFKKEQWLRSFLIGLLSGLLTALWSILFVIPGIVKTYAYSAAYYVALDDDSKKMSAMDCLRQSEKLMKGHKWQLFMLDLSFIGWYFLGAMAFGVGTLFVIPYHQTARAAFYDKIVRG